MKTLQESILDKQKTLQNSGFIPLITEWLRENFHIGSYTINPETLAIDVRGSVSVKNRNIEEFPGYIHFGEVDGYFILSSCAKLKSLRGCPKKVGEGFFCNYCTSLKNLIGAPEVVIGDFNCGYCDSLESLEGCPKRITKDCECQNNKNIKSYSKYCPEFVGRNMYVSVKDPRDQKECEKIIREINRKCEVFGEVVICSRG